MKDSVFRHLSFSLLMMLLFPLFAFSQPFPETDEAIRKGLLSIYKKEIPAAIDQLRSALETESPQKASAYYYLGYAYYLNDQFRESMEAFQEAYELSPELSPLPAINASGFESSPEEAAPETTVDTESLSAAMDSEPEEKTGMPDNPHFKQGILYLSKKDFSNAAGAFQSATGDAPTRAGFFYYMGYSYYKVKEYEKARAAFQEAFQIHPDYLPPLPAKEN